MNKSEQRITSDLIKYGRTLLGIPACINNAHRKVLYSLCNPIAQAARLYVQPVGEGEYVEYWVHVVAVSSDVHIDDTWIPATIDSDLLIDY